MTTLVRTPGRRQRRRPLIVTLLTLLGVTGWMSAAEAGHQVNAKPYTRTLNREP